MNDPMESIYFGVHLWRRADRSRRRSRSRCGILRGSFGDQTYPAPEGLVYVDAENLHTWRKLRIGRVNPSGGFDIVWDSGYLIRPEPYPASRTHEEWDALVDSFYKGWGQRWRIRPRPEAVSPCTVPDCSLSMSGLIPSTPDSAAQSANMNPFLPVHTRFILASTDDLRTFRL